MANHLSLQALVLCLPALMLAGCKQTVDQGPAHSLAQQCVTLQSTTNQHYLTRLDERHFGYTADAAQAESFFVKPARLGSFLLYDTDGGFLGTQLISVTRESTPSLRTEWEIHQVDLQQRGRTVQQVYSLRNPVDDLYLHSGQQEPILKAHPAQLPLAATFDLIPQPAEACRAYPEAPLDAEVAESFYEPKPADAPVQGFVDLHTHLGFPKAMAGLAMAGDLFHPYGIEHALKDCRYLHGTNGTLDLLESERANEGEIGHATSGYPDFEYWPRRDTSTHVQAYYRWLQRGYLSGLRLLVTDVTGNPTACQLFSLLKPGKAQGDCNSASEVENQTRYIYDLQDYIDAQEGGPGKGWFRIVTDPRQAREVINQNKLAVVLGSEYGTLFDCHESSAICTPDYIDAQLEKLHALGIRSVFPIHRFDNGFGGTRPAGGPAGAWMHLASKLSTSNAPSLLQMFDPWGYLFKPIGGHYWELEECPAEAEGTQGIMSMEEFVNQDFRGITAGLTDIPTIGPTLNAVLNFAFFNKLAPLPDYAEFSPEQRVCNRIGLHPLGRHLINGLIERGMIIEIDHMSYYTSLDALAILEQRQYSGVVSSHGWIDNTPALRERIFRLGGQITPFNSKPSVNAQRMKTYAEEMAPFGFSIGIGIGSDVQGVTSQTDFDEVQIEYPFTSVDGLVTFTTPGTGNRQFDYRSEGMAHYGMLAEWMENFRQMDAADPADLTRLLMNSAEAYLQMWERAELHQQARYVLRPMPESAGLETANEDPTTPGAGTNALRTSAAISLLQRSGTGHHPPQCQHPTHAARLPLPYFDALSRRRHQ